MTTHNRAKKGEIAKVVLMAGDPLRVKWIAENFLDNVKLVNDIRSTYCYTGEYKGKLVSIMAHGMGNPSIGIYSYELFKFYDVDIIIRIGSAGSYSSSINISDLILVKESYSESTYAKLLNNYNDDVFYPSENVNNLIINVAKQNNLPLNVVRCHSSDVFYSNEKLDSIIKRTHAQCVEMESFALFVNAKMLNKSAAVILTCSDSLVTGDALSPDMRQTSFTNMIKLALESAIKLI